MKDTQKTLKIHAVLLKNRQAARTFAVAVLRRTLKQRRRQRRSRMAEVLGATLAHRNDLDKDLFTHLKSVNAEIRRLEQRCAALEQRKKKKDEAKASKTRGKCRILRLWLYSTLRLWPRVRHRGTTALPVSLSRAQARRNVRTYIRIIIFLADTNRKPAKA